MQNILLRFGVGKISEDSCVNSDINSKMPTSSYPNYSEKDGSCSCSTVLTDHQGNEVGCITGYRGKRSTNIVFLRGDPRPVRKSQKCQIHNSVQNDNELNESRIMDNHPKFSFKDVIITWNTAVEATKRGEWEVAFNTLQAIKDYSAKMRFNLGQIAWASEKPDLAKENFLAAVEKDSHMALAHFQLGMVYYRLHRYNDSRSSYDKAKSSLRGNKFIDYRQLGFVHKLYECEVLYNLALTYATMMNNSEFALELLQQASKVTVESRQSSLIEKAQTQLMNNQLYEPIVLPGNQLFRPPQSKVANLKNIDYLGKAKVLSELPDSSNNNNKANFQVLGKGLSSPPNTFRPIDDDFSDDDIPSPTHFSYGSTSPTPSMMAKMTHKDTIAMWHEGVVAYEMGNVDESLNQLNSIIDPSAKILYDIGVLQKKQGQLEDAYSTFKEVVSKDPHLAIGHFQLGLVLGQLQRYEEAWRAFEKTHETLRGNKMIDYKQLGLQYKLHKCEVLHNEAWTYNELDQRDWARKLLDEAKDCKSDPRHDKIDESIRNFSSGYSFQLLEPPKTLLFKPPKSKIDNLDRKDYLGKAKIIAKLPSQRRGSSTPPPNANSLGVTVLPPRSRTPTPSSAGFKMPDAAPPSRPLPVNRTTSASPALPARPVPSPVPRLSLPDSQAPWKMPVPTIETSRSRSPGPPSRPPPSKAPEERKLSLGFNPDKALPVPPSPNDTEEHHQSNRRLSADAPPSRPLPSPSRTSPIPERPVPAPPRKMSSPELPQRPVPPSPRMARADLGNRPVPPRPKNSSSDLQSRAIPPPPGNDEPDFPSRPVPPVPRLSTTDLPNRPLPPSPHDLAPEYLTKSGSPLLMNSPVDLPNRPVPAVPRASSLDLPSRPAPTSPKLPTRPVPSSPKLPSRPVPQKSESVQPNDLTSRALPPPPVSRTGEPELPPRPNPVLLKTSSTGPPTRSLPGQPRRGSPELPDRPVPPPPAPTGNKNYREERKPSSPELPDRPVPAPPAGNKNYREEKRPSSPGLPDLPPPPPPQRMPSPVPPRKQAGHQIASQERKAPGHKAKLVQIQHDSPPVIRKAAAVIVQQKENKPSLPTRPGAADKPVFPSNKPPIMAFKPEVKQFGGHGVKPGHAGRRKTALVIASHEADTEGEVSVLEGDLISILGEEGDWLEVEVKGVKGHLPRSCVKDFNKPNITL